ncbi:Clavaminate synthase-like protein [Aureobasidium sp. EXF-10728]|nr:Clavaminate synthase-like protein [Aureobasidium sp. EXF-10728]
MTRTKKNKPGGGPRADKQKKAAKPAAPKLYTAPTITSTTQIPHWKLGQPQEFYTNFVHKRQPVVIQGKLEDLDFVTKNWADVGYLRKTAGDAKVKVEPMHKEKKRYGTDVQRVDTTFGAFLDSLKEEKDEYDYLTTQYSDDEDDMDDSDDDEENEDAQDNEIKNGTFPQPVRALLRKDVPMRPAIMGNLVLQQMNMWLGKTKSGTSSGLHHDFHDNLYILLKGRKRFVLYPPSAVHHLDTYGEPKQIHHNGLIVYKQPGEDEIDDDQDNEADAIRADGLVERDAAALRVQALEEAMDKLEASNNDDKKALDAIQKEYGHAVEQLMKYQATDFGELGEDDFDEVSSEEESEPEDLKDQVLRDDVPNGKKRKANDDLATPKATKTAKAVAQNDEDEDSAANDSDDSDADLLAALERAQNGQRDDFADSDSDAASDFSDAFAQDAIPSEPLSFSRLSTTDLHAHLSLSSPHTPSPALEKAGTPYIVDLRAGDMLYLPTSWFHEVTSFADGEEDVHMALNYWFHPPDAVVPGFEAPYGDMRLWRFMQAKVEDAYQGLVKE